MRSPTGRTLEMEITWKSEITLKSGRNLDITWKSGIHAENLEITDGPLAPD